MKLSESEKIIAVIQSLWPSWKPMETTGPAWAKALENYPYESVNDALIVASRRYTFPPSIKELIDVIEEMSGNKMTEGEHLEQLLSTLKRAGYMNPSAVASLSPENQKIVRRFGGWSQYGINSLPDETIRREYHFKFVDAEREVQIERERSKVAALQSGDDHAQLPRGGSSTTADNKRTAGNQ